MPTNPKSPFDTSGPSLLSQDAHFNGINTRRAKQAMALKKYPFVLNGKDMRTPFNQVNVYGRAVVSKTKEALGL